MIRVLVACEFSGVVRDAFNKRWPEQIEAYSVDLEPGRGWLAWARHYHGYVQRLFDDKELKKQKWDCLIAHPPCTFVCNSGVKHLYKNGRKENGPDEWRWHEMEKAVTFIRWLWRLPIKHKAIENPVMHGYAQRILAVPPTQIIHPWQFGHKETKATVLRLDNLPLLRPTNIVGPPPADKEERKSWEKVFRMAPSATRGQDRSITPRGIGDAMSEQWGRYLLGLAG